MALEIGVRVRGRLKIDRSELAWKSKLDVASCRLESKSAQ